MASPQSDGGCGIRSMPMKLDTVEQLVEICTTIVSTCSMGHASANFQQYEAYGYVPNFPATLMKMPPQTKVCFFLLISNTCCCDHDKIRVLRLNFSKQDHF
jgi:hypothetical protein